MTQNRKPAPALGKWLAGYNQLMAKMIADGFKQTSTNAREGLANLTNALVTDRPEIQWIQDDLVDGEDFNVPVRLYHPDPDTHLPILIYFHGGGGMAGSITVYDTICRKLALASHHLVVSVDYRLAPECPYPCGFNDALTVVRNIWLTLDRRNLNYTRQLSLGGDSGGGALCASVVHATQNDRAVDIRRQFLLYPSLDYTMELASIEKNGQGYLLEKNKIQWFFDNYFQNQENRREVSPLFMEFSSNLPETLVITAEFCPLRDEGFEYVNKLQQRGVDVKHLHFDDMIHAFVNMENIVKEQCSTYYREVGSFLM